MLINNNLLPTKTALILTKNALKLTINLHMLKDIAKRQ
ncbi:hypothetical protein CPS_5024 [Colwellia psychrerythraea 34H]|uniref:Uncharacterized protein n=1 Tax=Colwellia psychrerythraea (strain 34H / ATCC BAA-681) TaxID=167879 RepID=Q47U60_COLP3|nr:hypothetical protein CPS_5024 [Colwellia psychrerythraea 34H]